MKVLILTKILFCAALDFQLVRNFQTQLDSPNTISRSKRDSPSNIRTIKNDIMEILPAFRNFTDFDMPAIRDHGCWCSRLLHGQKHNKGTRPTDLYDIFCRRWFKARDCLKLLKGPCENLNEKLVAEYEIQLENGKISLDSEYHCTPNTDRNESIIGMCKYSNCKIDHAFAIDRLVRNFTIIEGNHKECDTTKVNTKEEEEDSEHSAESESGKVKYCALLEHEPWAEIRFLANRKKKLAPANRLSTRFRNHFLQNVK